MQASKIREAAVVEAKEKALLKVNQKKGELDNRSETFLKKLEAEKVELEGKKEEKLEWHLEVTVGVEKL